MCTCVCVLVKDLIPYYWLLKTVFLYVCHSVLGPRKVYEMMPY